jgi:hypothetical protein
MESVDVRFSKPGVANTTPNDVKWGYYYPKLVDHLELKSLEVSTSSSPKIETQFATVGGVEALLNVGPLLFSPLNKAWHFTRKYKDFRFGHL